MKRFFLMAALIVSASTFTFAQSAEELKEAERIKEMINNGTLDSIIQSATKDNDDDNEEIANPFDSQPEEVVRGMNDARRESYEELAKNLALSGHTIEESGVQHAKMDSVGIYASIDGKLVAMKHINYHESTGTGFDNPLAKSKDLLVFNGKTSPYTFTGKARFRIYFTHDKYSISAYYDMFSSDYVIDDFYVSKFKIVPKGRQLTSATWNRQHTRAEGAKNDESVKLNVVKVRENVYDMIVEGAPGEYCLTYNLKKGTFGGSKNTGSKSVFDFTIK